MKMIPFRLCCGQQHLGVVCPDNKVMCCYCFDRVSIEALTIDNGDRIDVCQVCWNLEQEQLKSVTDRWRRYTGE